jgi:flagellar biosynthesis/type III secretory pathway protein FliH
MPITREKLAQEKDLSYATGYNQGLQAGKQFQSETQRATLIREATNIIAESSKMMSRAGYLLDKINGVK